MIFLRRPAAALTAAVLLASVLAATSGAGSPAAAAGRQPVGPVAHAAARSHALEALAGHRRAPTRTIAAPDGDLGPAVPAGTVIEPGQFLSAGVDFLPMARAVMQPDGNFVIYTGDRTPVFASRTTRFPGSYAVFQGDGNFVLYTPEGVPLWASRTTGVRADTLYLDYVDDEADLAVLRLDPQGDDDVAIFWDSELSPLAIPTLVPPTPDRLTTGQQIRTDQLLVTRTLADGTVWYLTLQADSNIVLLDQDFEPRWAAGTRGRGGVRLVQQGDGNLVLYRADGVAVWSSGTARHPGARTVLQTDGNAVVYGPDNRALKVVASPRR